MINMYDIYILWILYAYIPVGVTNVGQFGTVQSASAIPRISATSECMYLKSEI